MRRNTAFNFLRCTRNVHVDLLEGAEVIFLVVFEECNRTHHPGSRTEQVETRVLATLSDGDVADFKVHRHLGAAFGFELSQKVGELLGLCCCSPTNDATVELNDDGFAAVNVGSKDLGHAVSRQELGNL